MSRRTSIPILIVFITIVLFIIWAFVYPEWKWSGHLQSTLDALYVPTAQALVQNSEPIPSFLTISPSPASVIEAGEQINIGVYSGRLSASSFDVFEWTRLYINGVRIAPDDYNAAFGGPLEPPYQLIEPSFYLSPELQPGFHLIEVRVGTSIMVLLNPSEARSYAWAYQVE
jgi:hypothetical protein